MTLLHQLMRLVQVEQVLSRDADKSRGTISQMRRNFWPFLASTTGSL